MDIGTTLFTIQVLGVWNKLSKSVLGTCTCSEYGGACVHLTAAVMRLMAEKAPAPPLDYTLHFLEAIKEKLASAFLEYEVSEAFQDASPLVDLKFHKLQVYGPGATYEARQEGDAYEAMAGQRLGTLMVVLPGKHEGKAIYILQIQRTMRCAVNFNRTQVATH